MKLLIFLLLSVTVSAQPGYNRFTSRNHWYGIKSDAFHVPAGAYPSLAIGQWNGDGALRFDSVHRRLYYYYNGAWIGLRDTTETVASSTTLQQAINNSGSISQNSVIGLSANLFIGDNIGIDFRNSAPILELYGEDIRINRGWTGGGGGLAGLGAGTGTDSLVTINQSTGELTMRNSRWMAKVGSTTSSATPTINTDLTDIYKLTAQAVDVTSFTTNLSGSPNDGDILEIQVTGTATRNLTFGASFVSSTVTIPTATDGTNTLTIIFQWYTTSSYGNSKWLCVNSY